MTVELSAWTGAPGETMMRHIATATAIVIGIMTIIIRIDTAIDTPIVSTTLTITIHTPTTIIGLAADSEFLVRALCSSLAIAATGVMIEPRKALALVKA